MVWTCLSLSLQEEFDTHDPKAHHFLKLPFLKKRSRIVEIVAARDTVFALTHSGICAAFSRGWTLACTPWLLWVDLGSERPSRGRGFLMVYLGVVTDTNKRICFLNISADEVIRSLFYNKNNDSLITVSVYASDNFSSLKCRTAPIE
jgi:hypothetical protein